MGQVSVHDARNRLSQLIRDAQAGEEVVIASHGKPVVRLVPVRRSTGADLLTWLQEHPRPAAWRTQAEAEVAIAQERESWE